MTGARTPEGAAYDPFETDLLLRLGAMSVRHPDDPDALDAGELRRWPLTPCFTGPGRDGVDMEIDRLAGLLDGARADDARAPHGTDGRGRTT